MTSFWLDTARGFLSGSIRSGFSKRHGIRILVYHGVVEKKKDSKLERNFHLLANFRDQVRMLTKLPVIPLAQVSAFLKSTQNIPDDCYVITFDDGYANTLIAAELLNDARLPWTLFASTGAIGEGKAIWTIELSLLLLKGRRKQIDLLDKRWPLKTDSDREYAFESIRHPMKQLPADQRRRLMEELRAQYPAGESATLLEENPAFRMLDWDDIRALKSTGIEIGSHGLQHEIHHKSQERSIRVEELMQSKVKLECEIGYACRFFAFPNGDWTDTSVEEVKEAGYELALTTEPGTVRSGSNPYLLPRLESPGSLKAMVSKVFWNGAYRESSK